MQALDDAGLRADIQSMDYIETARLRLRPWKGPLARGSRRWGQR